MTDSPSLARLGELVLAKRGKVGLRATAREIGLSPATLSRIENGRLPDIENFQRLCRWLELNPARVLGFDPDILERPVATVHFRSQDALSLDTAGALQELIVEAQMTFSGEQQEEEATEEEATEEEEEDD